MSATTRHTDADRIDEQIADYAENDPSRNPLSETTPDSLLRHLAPDTPLELIGAYALKHDICNVGYDSTQFLKLKEAAQNDE